MTARDCQAFPRESSCVTVDISGFPTRICSCSEDYCNSDEKTIIRHQGLLKTCFFSSIRAGNFQMFHFSSSYRGLQLCHTVASVHNLVRPYVTRLSYDYTTWSVVIYYTNFWSFPSKFLQTSEKWFSILPVNCCHRPVERWRLSEFQGALHVFLVDKHRNVFKHSCRTEIFALSLFVSVTNCLLHKLWTNDPVLIIISTLSSVNLRLSQP